MQSTTAATTTCGAALWLRRGDSRRLPPSVVLPVVVYGGLVVRSANCRRSTTRLGVQRCDLLVSYNVGHGNPVNVSHTILTDTGATSQIKSTQTSFKIFKTSGATEFNGVSDPIVAIEWLLNTEKVFRISKVSEEDKVNYATAMFVSSALVWWDATYQSLKEVERNTLTWEVFKTIFHEQYCPADLQKRLEKEFIDIKQGDLTVVQYETQFNLKARFASRFVTSEQHKIEHFVDGLRREIQESVSNRDITSF
ncbi:hypothetical protein OSB04_007615 [Centaurea solstitialis]|uniref:Retrotransposon gag domain-containing protein n=1 Tax=Centaurea solstitialis TaxID=347529 RepID=A0AA38TK74_9ASTR|nr:hypothetical protein OSB04_007615 [Centaurea solstitialis]